MSFYNLQFHLKMSWETNFREAVVSFYEISEKQERRGDAAGKGAVN